MKNYVLNVSHVLCVCMWYQYVCFECSLKLEPEQENVLSQNAMHGCVLGDEVKVCTVAEFLRSTVSDIRIPY